MIVTKRVCKICNLEKVRVQDGYYDNGKDKRWVDRDLKQWSGTTCPDCHRERVKLRKRSLDKAVKDASN